MREIICTLYIKDYNDRDDLILALVHSGYTVKVSYDDANNCNKIEVFSLHEVEG